jgi:hypothetical protein
MVVADLVMVNLTILDGSSRVVLDLKLPRDVVKQLIATAMAAKEKAQ